MNNSSIQLLRGSNDRIVANSSNEILLDGQPLFNKSKNYLSVGNGSSNLVNVEPISTPSLKGWFLDYETGKYLNKSGMEYTTPDFYVGQKETNGNKDVLQFYSNHKGYIYANDELHLHSSATKVATNTTELKATDSIKLTSPRINIENDDNKQYEISLSPTLSIETDANYGYTALKHSGRSLMGFCDSELACANGPVYANLLYIYNEDDEKDYWLMRKLDTADLSSRKFTLKDSSYYPSFSNMLGKDISIESSVIQRNYRLVCDNRSWGNSMTSPLTVITPCLELTGANGPVLTTDTDVLNLLGNVHNIQVGMLETLYYKDDDSLHNDNAGCATFFISKLFGEANDTGNLVATSNESAGITFQFNPEKNENAYVIFWMNDKDISFTTALGIRLYVDWDNRFRIASTKANFNPNLVKIDPRHTLAWIDVDNDCTIGPVSRSETFEEAAIFGPIFI